jgi:hypothetical protein
MWSVHETEDEFGDKTGDKVIIGSSKGTFSNAITTNSPLWAYILTYSSGRIAMRIYEYSDDQPAILIEGSDVAVSIQDNAGQKHSISGYTQNTNNYILFRESDGNKLINILSAGGLIKFRITVSLLGSVSERYSFDLENADGFEAVLQDL